MRILSTENDFNCFRELPFQLYSLCSAGGFAWCINLISWVRVRGAHSSRTVNGPKYSSSFGNDFKKLYLAPCFIIGRNIL